MSWETMHQLRSIGVALLLVAALLLLLINMVVARLSPRLVPALMVLVWLAGTLGFALVLIVDHSPFNVALAVLFVVVIGFHGWRIVKRSRRNVKRQEESDREEP